MLTATERNIVETWRRSAAPPHELIAIIDRLVGRAAPPYVPGPDERPMMVHVAGALDNFFNNGREPGEPRQTGFVLMVFPFDGSTTTKCISNGASRKDVIEMCRLTLAEMEGGEA